MFKISGFEVQEEIFQSWSTLVYRAVRVSDQKPVIIKTHFSDFPGLTEKARF